MEQKNALQNQFLASISKTNSQIMSWLEPQNASKITENHKNAPDKAPLYADFFKLPILSAGSGVSFTENSLKIETIDDQIKSRKNIKGTPKSSKFGMNRDKLAAKQNDSASLRSLKNRIRKDNRSSAVKKVNEMNLNRNSVTKNDDSDDSDAELLKQKSKKKSSRMAFGKKKDPFK